MNDYWNELCQNRLRIQMDDEIVFDSSKLETHYEMILIFISIIGILIGFLLAYGIFFFIDLIEIFALLYKSRKYYKKVKIKILDIIIKMLESKINIIRYYKEKTKTKIIIIH